MMLPGLAAAAGQSGSAPAPQHSTAYKSPRKGPTNEFDVADWLSLTPAGNSLIRDPRQGAPVDLTARDDDTNVTVYGRKKHPDLSPPPPLGYAPLENEVAEPRDLRIVPPTHCANAAYSDVGGQSANGSDLIGALGSSDGC
jgi:hypothetical protein